MFWRNEMKKVWILERFVSHEEMVKHNEKNKKMVELAEVNGESSEVIASLNDFVNNYEKIISNNPDGYWYGFEGELKYSDFCCSAKNVIRQYPNDKFRVVEGKIKDGAKFWTGYELVKVNNSVLYYLMASI